MTIAYKYCDRYGAAILDNCELRVTPPNQFNDPFEFTPHMVCSDPQGYARLMLRSKDNLRTIYEGLARDGAFDGTFRDFREWVQVEKAGVIEIAKRGMPLCLMNTQKEFVERVSERFGLLCLSKRHDSILMWGHYTDKHRGLVIGFDTSLEVFRQGKGLRSVKYVRERVRYDATWKLGSVPLLRYEDEILLSKNADWEYEQEQRQIFILSTLKKKPLDDGTTGFFLPFSTDAVAQVILGARCSSDLAKRAKELVPSKFPKAQVLRASLHESQFTLTIAPVSGHLLRT